MPPLRILFLNLGYARGIGGRLRDHIRRAHRHFYCPPSVQRQSLAAFAQLIHDVSPDLCCMVEIDQGGRTRASLNQIDALKSDVYAFSDIENKYGATSLLRSTPGFSGKSNGFLARKKFPFEKMFFAAGTKKLIYKISLTPKLTLFFAHFSLQKAVRTKQILEARTLMKSEKAECIFLGDFNVLSGLQEVNPLLADGDFVLLNDPQTPTFFFHTRKHVLDLCVCSRTLAEKAKLSVINQAFTDHAALVLTLSPSICSLDEH